MVEHQADPAALRIRLACCPRCSFDLVGGHGTRSTCGACGHSWQTEAAERRPTPAPDTEDRGTSALTEADRAEVRRRLDGRADRGCWS
jgi:hypothetical protein